MIDEKQRRRVPGGLSIVGITTFFVAAFFVLRALPNAECGFLHYVEIVNEDGEIELCATNHAGFLDLTVLDYPIEIEIDAEGLVFPLDAPIELEMSLETDGGMSIAPHELAITHTEKMHLMLIDSTLTDYHHVHPEPIGLSGRYRFSFQPTQPGPYKAYAEIVPNRSRRQAVTTVLFGEGEGVRGPQFSERHAYDAGSARFVLHGVADRMRVNRDYRLELAVLNQSGLPANLEEVMGAMAHMVAFDAAGKGFAHMHPEDSVAISRAGIGAEPQPGDRIAFLLNVPNPGWYRLFAQVQIDGEAVFGRFDLKVE